MECRVENGEALRRRDVLRLPLLRAAAICGRYANTSANLIVRLGRRQACKAGDIKLRLFEGFRRPCEVALSNESQTIHTSVCALLGFNARRFCKAPRRPAICQRTFRRSSGGIRLVLQTNRPQKRHAPPDAKPLEFCRLGDYMEARLRAGIGKRRFGDKFFALCIRAKKRRKLNALYGMRARSRRIRPKEP